MSLTALRKVENLKSVVNDVNYIMQFRHGGLKTIIINGTPFEVMKVDAYDEEDNLLSIDFNDPELLKDLKKIHNNVYTSFILGNNTLVITYKSPVTILKKMKISKIYIDVLLYLKGNLNGLDYIFHFVSKRLDSININGFSFDVIEAVGFNVQGDRERFDFGDERMRIFLNNFLTTIRRAEIVGDTFTIICRDPVDIGNNMLIEIIDFKLKPIYNGSQLLQVAR